ncbi:MAG TPA: nucleotide exchange factor GrpE [Solirubrobacterales bacterium]|jgi:molecular chaperone GrpE|nr:nucleotide exchange factor GrpE [Solirubrobacterales bacterium]
MPSSPASEEEQQAGQAAGAAQVTNQESGSTQPPPRDDERYLRALADLENYRKRSAQEVERRVSEQAERLLLDWIEAVDSVDRALGMQPSDGLRRVLEQMEGILARQGVARVGAVGDRFDPELHEAISVQESDEVPDRTVLDVARSGYRHSERVLRPAQVVVSRHGGGSEQKRKPSEERKD